MTTQVNKRKRISAVNKALDELLLDEREKIFVEHLVILGRSKAEAMKAAGIEHDNYDTMMLRPNVQRAILESQAHCQQQLNLSRERVLQGMLEAVEMARSMGDPKVMIQGWKEIAAVSGYLNHAKQVNINATGEMTVKNLSAMSTEQLLQLASGTVIDGEATVIPAQPEPAKLKES